MGGLLNVFVAPLVFQGRVLEYPLAFLLACLLTPSLGGTTFRERFLDMLGPCGAGILALVLAVSLRGTEANFSWPVPLLTVSVPLLVGLAFSDRPFHFVVPLAAALVIGFGDTPKAGPVLYTERNFFGLLSIQDQQEDGQTIRTLSHGSTQHGSQPLDAAGQPLRDSEPTRYYVRNGPIGAIFRQWDATRCRGGWRSSAWVPAVWRATPVAARSGRSTRSIRR